MTERRIRYSQFAKFKRCRRSWMFEYVQGLELDRPAGVTKGPRDIGTLFHLGVEAYYNAEDPHGALRAKRDELIAAEAWSQDWADHFELVTIMLTGYVQWVAETAADAHENVLLVEPQLEVPFAEVRGDLVILTGKPDLVVHNTLSDTNIVVDTKTVASIEQVQHHSGQGLTYALLLKEQHGLDIGMFRTNQARKVKRTARANPPFYGHAEMLVTPKHLDTHRRHLLGQLDEMVRLMQQWEEEGYSNREHHDTSFYPNPTPDCKWDCDFLAVCKQMDDGFNFEHTIRSFYRKKPETATTQEAISG